MISFFLTGFLGLMYLGLDAGVALISALAFHTENNNKIITENSAQIAVKVKLHKRNLNRPFRRTI